MCMRFYYNPYGGSLSPRQYVDAAGQRMRDHHFWGAIEPSGVAKTTSDVRLCVGQMPFNASAWNVTWLLELESEGVRVRKVEAVVAHTGDRPRHQGCFHVYCSNGTDAERVLRAHRKAFCTRHYVRCCRDWGRGDLEAACDAERALRDVNGGGPNNLMTVQYATSTYKCRSSATATRTHSKTAPPVAVPTTCQDDTRDEAAADGTTFLDDSFVDDLAAAVAGDPDVSPAEHARASNALRCLTQFLMGNDDVIVSDLRNVLLAAVDRSESSRAGDAAAEHLALLHALQSPRFDHLESMLRQGGGLSEEGGNDGITPIAAALRRMAEEETSCAADSTTFYLINFWRWMHARGYVFATRRS